MRTPSFLTVILTIWLLLSCPTTVSAQAQAGSIEQLRVTVVDEVGETPIDGARVELLEAGTAISEAVTDASGVVTFTVTVVSTAQLPDNGFALSPPYPNPSGGRVTLPLSMSEGGQVTVMVVDLLGRTVAEGTNLLSAGRHEITLNLNGLPAGSYFTRVSSGIRSATSSALIRTRSTPGSPSVSFIPGPVVNDIFRKNGSTGNEFDLRIVASDYDERTVRINAGDSTDVRVGLALTPVVPEETVVVDSTDLSLAAMTENGLTFSVEGSIPDIAPGDVLAGEQGDAGYLRRVVGVEVDGDSVRVVTEQASLTDAIENGTFHSSVAFGALGKREGWIVTHMADGASFCEDGITLVCLDSLTVWEGEYEANGISGTARVYFPSGGLNFEPGFDIEGRIRRRSVEYFSAIATGELTLSADLAVEASGAFKHAHEKEIFEVKHIAVQLVGVVPVYEVVTVSVEVGYTIETGVEGRIEAGFETGTGLVRVGAIWENESWREVYEQAPFFEEHPLSWEASAHATIRAYVRPRLDVKLYDVAGPFLFLEPYLRLEGAVNYPDWNWALYGGLDAFLGFDVTIADRELASFSRPLLAVERPIGDGSGQFLSHPPDAPFNPSPAGGAADVSLSTTLSWSGSDPDGDTLGYEVFFGTANPPAGGFATTDTSYDPGTLSNGTTYYWQIAASDGQETTTGPVWSFTTASAGGGGAPFSTMTNSIGMEMIRIPAGSFEMGSNVGNSNEQPIHEVTLTQDFWLSTYEVTQEEYVAVTGQNPSEFSGSGRLPVEQVSWLDAIAFANSLSTSEGLSPCYDSSGNVIGGDIYACEAYRLPSEAEWEYAARAGTTTEYSFGNDAGQLGDFAWYSANSSSRTHPVGEKQPNPWGLYDVNGNLWEWVHDLFGDSYYSQSPGTDPPGPSLGSLRVFRGGAWDSGAGGLRSADRSRGGTPSGRGNNIGFRLARAAPGGSSANLPPASPSPTSPDDGAADVSLSTTLSWAGSDPDGDTLGYEVFFGTANPPAGGFSTTDTSYDPGTLSSGTTYYWQIAVSDGQETTTGPVWSFTTASTGEGGTQDGLVALYTFTGSAEDASGNNNDGVIVGASLAEDRFGNQASALRLRTGNKVRVPSSTSLESLDADLTISAWVKRDSHDLTGFVISKRAPSATGSPIHFTMHVNAPYGFYFQIHEPGIPGSNALIRAQDAYSRLNDGQWHQIAVRHRYGDPSSTKLFLDGEDVTDVATSWSQHGGTGSAPAFTSSDAMLIGRQDSFSAGHYRGFIDGIRIYSRLLSDQEIVNLFNSGTD